MPELSQRQIELFEFDAEQVAFIESLMKLTYSRGILEGMDQIIEIHNQ